jgi:hypothetical protein
VARLLSATLSDAVRFFHSLMCFDRADDRALTAGARQVATGYNLAKQTGAKIFVTSMCIGTGMGMAAVFVNEQ